MDKIELDELKPNSHAYKEYCNKDKPATRVAKGKPKKNMVRKFSSFFVPEDVTDVKSYMLEDIFIPKLKDFLIEMLGGSTSSRRRDDRGSHYVSYRDAGRRDMDRRGRSRDKFDQYDAVMETRRDAEDVMRSMEETLDRYGLVKVSDFYEFTGIRGNWNDNKYGWTDISRARLYKSGHDWIIEMPRAMPID